MVEPRLTNHQVQLLVKGNLYDGKTQSQLDSVPFAWKFVSSPNEEVDSFYQRWNRAFTYFVHLFQFDKTYVPSNRNPWQKGREISNGMRNSDKPL